MELSQSSLAFLLLLGLPAGMLLRILYALTDSDPASVGILGKILRHVKDFVFVFFAGLLAILLIYYMNDGEFRYLILLGLIGGYLLISVTVAKAIVKIRNKLLKIIFGMITTPIAFLWSVTLAKPYARACHASLRKATKKQIKNRMHLASNGFEKNSEAKE